MARKSLPDLSIVLTFLREGQGVSLADLGRLSGISPNLLNDYEAGRKKLIRSRLDHIVSFLGLGPEAVDATLARLKANRAASQAPRDAADRPSPEHRRIEAVAGRMAGMAAEFGRSMLSFLTIEGDALRERQRADFLWARLKRRTPEERLALLEDSKKFRSWGICERVAAESIEAAADNPARALELARLALQIAELVPGEEPWRWRLQGYAGAFVANALRVSGDHPAADKVFARAKKLWEAGEPGGLGLLDAVWVPWIEATLRAAQRRFPEALRRIEEALEEDRGDHRSQILLSKARILGALGDAEKSTEALQEAAPLIDINQQPRTALGVRFELLVNLCLQDRAAEAEPRLGEVRDLAERLGKELDLVRVVWLEASVAAGVGRIPEAIAAFEQTRRAFVNRGIAFDYALVSLELALVFLKQGRTAEVRSIAQEMLAIFREQEVERETLAALRVFCDAAKQETATAELARRVILFLHRAQHDPGLRFEPGGETEALRQPRPPSESH
jgi:tetratricopeptide (TPR) repeat protein